MDSDSHCDWLGYAVRFVFGGLLGLVVGWYVCGHEHIDAPAAWYVLLGAVVACGAAAAYWGDAFWFRLRDWL